MEDNFIVEINAINHIVVENFGNALLAKCYKITTVPNPFFGISNAIDYSQKVFMLYPDTEQYEKYLHDAKNNPNEYFELYVMGYTKQYLPSIGEVYIHNSFGKKEKSNISIGEPIDLGLSIMWADRNVGAGKPSDYGVLFGYGDTSGENISEKESDYPNYDIIGTKEDIASTRWGNNWRMPSAEELKELAKECKWQPTVVDGVNGAKVTGPNGNSIFMPYAGVRMGTNTFRQGQLGMCWAGTKSNFGGCIEMMFFGYTASLNYGAICSNGHSIRPVIKK